MEEEEKSSDLCVEWEVPRDLLPHRDQLMPPLLLEFERSEENIWKIYPSSSSSSSSSNSSSSSSSMDLIETWCFREDLSQEPSNDP